jgi:predicted ATP-grasp superfamily ATP-dependent carboligase
MADVADLVNLRVDVGTLKQAVADQKQELQSLAQEFRSLR